MTTLLPPLTGTPLDYVPIDAPVYKTKPTIFRAPTLKRAFIAAVCIPPLAVGVPAYVALYCINWLLANLAEWLEADDAQ